ncbi:hypothetical protein MIND_01279700 [Mycena indigotica]|uniref:Uncharacterized protein n=1 Tax=Mycena indigotica TaxID=2126181 RepID=A0A8H6S2P7_9AGAR|nr:uncharacterized protein MIND_01279700 [Mycena indigotica]KAF7291352.1 hypothetical protein MIND_01279700 [Mycena indigotica]
MNTTYLPASPPDSRSLSPVAPFDLAVDPDEEQHEPIWGFNAALLPGDADQTEDSPSHPQGQISELITSFSTAKRQAERARRRTIVEVEAEGESPAKRLHVDPPPGPGQPALDVDGVEVEDWVDVDGALLAWLDRLANEEALRLQQAAKLAGGPKKEGDSEEMQDVAQAVPEERWVIVEAPPDGPHASKPMLDVVSESVSAPLSPQDLVAPMVIDPEPSPSPSPSPSRSPSPDRPPRRCPCARCSPNEPYNVNSALSTDQRDEIHRLFSLSPFAMGMA